MHKEMRASMTLQWHYCHSYSGIIAIATHRPKTKARDNLHIDNLSGKDEGMAVTI